ncbi:MAG: potassium transporter Kup [Micavibrio aeruginosavorus]|uniref:Probable potassium transport system protein Kup n=1 Tax=Micavibrio aeruginosavorus TaxID=349221 RepID=A0A2W5N1Q6_9BACT|nr:MAG: potassium transporter Kup [Micavibrio aeruginosavorus]
MSSQAAGPLSDADQPNTCTENHHASHAHGPGHFRALLIGCIGVVYGDIGTSPLYAFREAAHHIAGDGVTNGELLGILSLILWSLTLVVTVKYVLFLLRVDNKGEGGILSLMALNQRSMGRQMGVVFFAGVIGAALFFGDGAITPAISVLSAVEGTKLITPAFEKFVLPISMAIIIGIFSVQQHGTANISKFFGPITIVWFMSLGLGGLSWIVKQPMVLHAFNPYYAFEFLFSHGFLSFVVLGSVFLAVTGAEALYSDLGHFGRKPIQIAWLYFVFPCLALNYLGQGALLMTLPATIENPFFLLYPEWALIPMVVLATLATIIAAQAVITGAYSVARQAIQLGLLPRMEIRHTSEKQEGQIYMPKVNSLLMYSVLFLCLVFQTSSSLASAYGIAVTGTFVASSILALNYLARVRGQGYLTASVIIVPLLFIEMTFFSSNLLKLFDGGFVPLVFGLYFVMLIVTWVKGTKYLVTKSQAQAIALIDLAEMLERDPPHIVDGTAIFLTSDPEHAPETMMQNLKHNQVLHEKNIILTISIAQIPRVPLEQRIVVEPINRHLICIVINFGFMETPNVPAALYRARALGYDIDVENASFFLGHRKIIPDARFGLPGWQDDIYVAMSKSAVDATDFFRIPPSQVVEIGTRQVV